MHLSHHPLRLVAHDTDDVMVFSCYLQDAVLPLASVNSVSEKGELTLLFNRFCWEHLENTSVENDSYYRIHTGVVFKNVTGIYRRNFDHDHASRLLSLLMVRIEPKDDGASCYLLFAHDVEIRIDMEKVHIQLNDIDHPWPTKKRPMHLYEHFEELTHFFS